MQMANPDDQGRVIETATEVGISAADRDAPHFMQGSALAAMANTFAEAALKIFPVDDRAAFLELYRSNFVTAYLMRTAARLEEVARGASKTVIRRPMSDAR